MRAVQARPVFFVLRRAVLLCVALAGCGDDAKPATDTTAADSATDTAVADSAPADSAPADSAPADTSEDDVAADVAIDTADLTPCERACVEGNPDGAGMLRAWIDCQVETCKDFDPESPEGGACVNDSWAPHNPAAPCRAETVACFSGEYAGCKELVDLAAEHCEPPELPMTFEELGGVVLCMIELGFNAQPSVQALAFPLFACAFPLEGGPGCTQECVAGAEGCRACAATKCKPEYDACIADATGTPVSFYQPTGATAACQEAFRCMSMCP